MPTADDQRTAAGLAATLSGQIVAASLAMIGVLGAVLVFVLDKRRPSALGWALVIVSFGLFVFSVAAGAKGVASIYRRGNEGDWNYLAGDGWFQTQAIAAIVGVLLFPLGIGVMGSPVSASEISRLTVAVDSLRQRVAESHDATTQLSAAVDSLHHAPSMCACKSSSK